MPKVKAGISQSDWDSAESGGYSEYDGPVPPKGVYSLRAEKIELTTSRSSDNTMLRCLWVVDGKVDKTKAKFDGAPIWDNVVFTAAAMWRVKAFAAALGITKRADMDNLVTDSDNKVTRIGTVKITLGAKGTTVRASLKQGQNLDGDPRSEINNYMPKGGAPTDEEDEATDAAADADEDEEETGVSPVDEDADDADEEEDDEEDEEELDPEELKTMSIKELRSLAKEQGWSVKDLKGVGKDDLIEMLTETDDEDDDASQDGEAPF